MTSDEEMELLIQRKREREAANLAELQRIAALYPIQYPALTGSEKQITWAQDIREQKVAQAWAERAEHFESGHDESEWQPFAEKIQGMVNRHSDARWWIDNRSKRVTGYLLNW